jgi:transcription elongation factor GreA
MSDKHFIPMTPEGLEKVKAELSRLRKEERPNVIEAIATARAHGDLSENAEYDAAKERQGRVEDRIAELQDKIQRAQIVETASADQILFGAFVKVQEEGGSEVEQYQLVGADESNPAKGKMSTASPMGKAFLNKKRGDVVEVKIPSGALKMKILDFWYE